MLAQLYEFKYLYYFKNQYRNIQVERCIIIVGRSKVVLELEERELRARMEDEGECLKQFQAQQVPAHVNREVFKEMLSREGERKRMIEERAKSLLKKLKPFSFVQRDEEFKRENMKEKIESLKKSIHQTTAKQTTVNKQQTTAVKASSSQKNKISFQNAKKVEIETEIVTKKKENFQRIQKESKKNIYLNTNCCKDKSELKEKEAPLKAVVLDFIEQQVFMPQINHYTPYSRHTGMSKKEFDAVKKEKSFKSNANERKERIQREKSSVYHQLIKSIRFAVVVHLIQTFQSNSTCY